MRTISWKKTPLLALLSAYSSPIEVTQCICYCDLTNCGVHVRYHNILWFFFAHSAQFLTINEPQRNRTDLYTLDSDLLVSESFNKSFLTFTNSTQSFKIPQTMQIKLKVQRRCMSSEYNCYVYMYDLKIIIMYTYTTQLGPFPRACHMI